MPQADDRIDRLETKVDSLTENSYQNHLVILKSVEDLHLEMKNFQMSQTDKLHELDKKVASHASTFENLGKLVLGGGFASLLSIILYFKDNFFKH